MQNATTSNADTLTPEWRNVLSLIGVLALAVAYSTTIVPDHIALDGVTAMDEAYRGANGAARWALIIGRPVGAANLYFLYDVFNSVDAVKYIRMIGFVATAAAFTVFYRGLFIRFLGEIEAFCLSLSLCLLAPFVVIAYWGTLTGVALGAALGGVATVYIARSVSDIPVSETSMPRSIRVGRLLALRPRPFVTAIAVVFLAASCYPSATFIVTLLPLLHVLLPGPRNDMLTTMQVLAATVLALVAGSAVYLICWKIAVAIWFPNAALGNRDLIRSIDAISAKIGWYFSDALPQAASVLTLDANIWLAAFVLAVCVLQFAVLSVSWRERVVRALLWVALLPMSYGANLLAMENHASFRTLISFQPFVWVSLYVGMLGIWRFASARSEAVQWARARRNAILVAAACTLLIHQLVVRGPDITRPRIEELKAARNAVAQLLARDDVARVVIVRADWDLNLGPFAQINLLGVSSARPTWSAVSLFRILHVEAVRALPSFEIIQMSTDEFATFAPLVDDHVINFDTVLRAHFAKLGTPLPHRQ